MKKFIKVAMAAAVLATLTGAGEARSEGVMEMQVVEFTPDQVNLGADSRLSGLSAAAGAISAASYSGDTQAAEERLAALFSGSGVRPAAAPVHIAARPAAPAAARAIPVAQLPKAAYKSALEDLGGEEEEDSEDEDIKPSAADGEGEEEDTADAAAAAPGPLWQVMASGMAGILVVISFVALFPAAPLLLALGTAVLLTL